MWFGIAVGGGGALAVYFWPDHAVATQMFMYSILVIGVILFGLWSEKNQPNFLLWMGCLLLIHAGLLYLIRGVFPFRTFLTIIPLALIEIVVLAAVMFKLLKTDESS
jgi:hypothetical protein